MVAKKSKSDTKKKKTALKKPNVSKNKAVIKKPKKGQKFNFSWSFVPCSNEEEFALDFSDKEYAKFVSKPKAFRSLEITGNNYRGSQVTKPEVSIEEEDWPTCDCEPGKGCGDDCMNRQLFIECRLGHCQGGYGLRDEDGGCGNTACQTRKFPLTQVIKTPWCGWGLRVQEKVRRGRPIIEYCGEVITTDMCRERLSNLAKGDDFYFASLTSSLVLDAAGQGSNARFANHSCNPNCVMEKWLVGGVPRVVLSARENLAVGDQCLYNYNADTMDDLVKRQKCCCGSSNCCGLIGGRVSIAGEAEVIEQAEKMMQQSRPKLDKLKSLAEKAKEVKVSHDVRLKPLYQLIRKGEAWISSYDTCLAKLVPSSHTSNCGSNTSSSSATSISSSNSTSNSLPCFDEKTLRCLLDSIPNDLVITEASSLKDKVAKAEQVKKTVERLFPTLKDKFKEEMPLIPETDKEYTEPEKCGASMDVDVKQATESELIHEIVVESNSSIPRLNSVDDNGSIIQDSTGVVSIGSVGGQAVSTTMVSTKSENMPIEVAVSTTATSSSTSIPFTLVAPLSPVVSHSVVSIEPVGTRGLSMKKKGQEKGACSVTSSEDLISMEIPPQDQRPSMQQLEKTLALIEYCHPVSVGRSKARLEYVMNLLNSWAVKTCKELKIKYKPNMSKSGASANTVSKRNKNFDKEDTSNTSASAFKVADGGMKAVEAAVEAPLEVLTCELAQIVDLGFQFSDDNIQGQTKMVEEKNEILNMAKSSNTEVENVENINEPKKKRAKKEAQELHCFCRLKETSTEATMVKCEGGCDEWFHVPCVHETASRLKSRGKLCPFICPVCLYKKGCPSMLACAPPKPRNRKVLHATIQVLTKVLETARATLPVQGLHAVSFLACLVDAATEYTEKCEKALSNISLVGLDMPSSSSSSSSSSSPEVAPASLPLEEGAVSPSASSVSSPAPADSPPLDGVAVIKRMCYFVSEGLAMQIDVSDIIKRLRSVVWRVVVKGGLSSGGATLTKVQHATKGGSHDGCPSSLYQHWLVEAGSFGLDFLQAMLSYGDELGLSFCQEWAIVDNMVKQTRAWLLQCETLEFDSLELSNLSQFPYRALHLPPKLNLASEVGYRRLLAALAYQDTVLNDEQATCVQVKNDDVFACQVQSNDSKKAADLAEEIEREEPQSLNVAKYCLCRGVDDGRKMIGCDSCEEWYHVKCLFPHQIHAGASFICPICVELNKLALARAPPPPPPPPPLLVSAVQGSVVDDTAEISKLVDAPPPLAEALPHFEAPLVIEANGVSTVPFDSPPVVDTPPVVGAPPCALVAVDVSVTDIPAGLPLHRT